MKNGLLILLTGALLAACAPDPKNNVRTGANGDAVTTGTSAATQAPTDLSSGAGRNANAQGGVVAATGGSASSAKTPSGDAAEGSGSAAGGAANASVPTGPNTVAPGTETRGTTTGAPSTGTQAGGVTDSGTTDPSVISDDKAANAPSNTVTDNSNTTGNPSGSGAGASPTGTTDSTASTPAGEGSSLRGRITEFNAQDRTFSISGNDKVYRVSVTDTTAYSGQARDANAFFGARRSDRNVTVQGRIEGETVTATAVTLN